MDTIKGQFHPCTHDAANTPTLWMPMLQGVSISDATSPILINIIEKDLVALIDTGADLCLIDEDLAKRLSTLYQISSNSPTHGATGAGKATKYYLQIIVPSEGLHQTTLFQVQCVSSPLRQQGLLCDLSLGEDVIHNYELHLNRSQNSWTLTSLP
jgi:Retroviral aspartyl protease